MSISNSGGPSASLGAALRDLLVARVALPPELSQGRNPAGLTAQVQSTQGAAPQSGAEAGASTAMQRILLQVGNHLVTVSAALQLRPGDRLNISFQENGQVILRLANGQNLVGTLAGVQPANPAPAPAALPAMPALPIISLIQRALGKVMPYQGSLLETLARLLRLPSESLPPQVRQALQQLRESIPEARQLATAEGLKQALRQSGALAERQLFTAQAAPRQALADPGGFARLPADLKLALIQLYAALVRPAPGSAAQAAATPPPVWRPAGSRAEQPLLFPHPDFLKPPSPRGKARETVDNGELLRLIAQALSRIQTTQLNSLQQRQPGPDAPPVNTQVWLFEVPVQAGGQLSLFQFRLEQDQEERKGGGKNQKPQSVWRITLSFDLPPLGPMHSLVRIQQGRVSSTFWAERDETKRLLERELPRLNQALVSLGLDVEMLEALPGRPHFEPARQETNLINIRT